LAHEAIGQAIEMRTSVPEPQRNTSSDQRVKLVDCNRGKTWGGGTFWGFPRSRRP
jgi:hypothetical protein